MKRRQFMRRAAGAVVAVASAPLLLEAAAEPVIATLSEAPVYTLGTASSAAVATFPFFWSPEIMEGVLSVPLLDTLMAEEFGI
jgi:hypothetical protein